MRGKSVNGPDGGATESEQIVIAKLNQFGKEVRRMIDAQQGQHVTKINQLINLMNEIVERVEKLEGTGSKDEMK